MSKRSNVLPKKKQQKQVRTKTRKKTLIRQEKLYDPLTKTEKVFDVKLTEMRDANFYKYWPENLMPFTEKATLRERAFFDSLFTGGKMGRRLKRNNMIIGTYKNIAKDSGYSTKFIQRVMQKMTETDVIVRVQNGIHMLNPHIIFKGTTPSRKYAETQYKKYKEEEEKRQKQLQEVEKKRQKQLQEEKLLNGDIPLF